ncbi:MAG: hypothetical protein JW866_02435 [Ignavibacteriales bacterium]|nr:hypothetical protein [Ignavibacteriales bacterium]
MNTKQIKIILYVEDNFGMRKRAITELNNAFPGYKIIGAKSHPEAIDKIGHCIKDLFLVCTDGELERIMVNKSPQRTFGWDLIKDLKGRGYKGPVIYTGAARIPDGCHYLFDEISERKNGVELISRISRYMKEQ